MEIKTSVKTGKGIYLFLIIIVLMFTLSPLKWYYSLAIISCMILVAMLAVLQFIANNEMIVFRYPFNFFIADWKLGWGNVRGIVYVKKDLFVEGRNAKNEFLFEYFNEETGKVKIKRFFVNFSNDDLEKIKQLCEEMQVSFKLKKTYSE